MWLCRGFDVLSLASSVTHHVLECCWRYDDACCGVLLHNALELRRKVVSDRRFPPLGYTAYVCTIHYHIGAQSSVLDFSTLTDQHVADGFAECSIADLL